MLKLKLTAAEIVWNLSVIAAARMHLWVLALKVITSRIHGKDIRLILIIKKIKACLGIRIIADFL